MGKYRVIELGDKTEYVMEIGTDSIGRATMVTVSADDLEELNSDYINEHFGQLQDDACQRGLDEAWETARKLVFSKDNGGLDVHDLSKIFGSKSVNYVLKKYSASEAIEKIKAYEKKQKAEDDIKVGDEVRSKVNGLTYIVTLVSEGGYVLFRSDGNFATSCIINSFEKTGKHYDIDKILDEMKRED